LLNDIAAVFADGSRLRARPRERWGGTDAGMDAEVARLTVKADRFLEVDKLTSMFPDSATPVALMAAGYIT
jgi:hypothetical protein